MSDKVDAIIIGAGVIGACTAYELAKLGYKTLSIDKLPQAGYGSTSGSCAIIRTYYSTNDSCALAYEGWHHWKDWSGYLGHKVAESDLIQYHNTGCLVAKTDLNHHLKKVCAVMDELGCPYEHVSAADMQSYLPGVDKRKFFPAKTIDDSEFGLPTGGDLDGAVFFPCGGYVNDPMQSAANVQTAAQAHGAQFKFNTQVSKILSAHGRVSGVELSDGTVVNAPVVINVAGPHSSVINKMAGVSDNMQMSTRALRHEVAHVDAPAAFDTVNRIVTSDSDVQVYTRPSSANGKGFLIGSEDPECDEREWVDDPDTYNPEFSAQWKTLVMRLAQRIPDLGVPDTAKGVVALYDVTEDWMPIYDKSDLPGFYMACGTSGNQYKNAPVAGKLMAALVQAEAAGQNHDEDPVKLVLENTQYTLSLDAYSRNRKINENSSFSVIG